MNQLSHVNSQGESVMVEVSHKERSLRIAIAQAWIEMDQATWHTVCQGKGPKGEVLAVARVAGIMAAKRTSEIIPMCHPLEITGLAVDFTSVTVDNEMVRIIATLTAKNIGRTGIEMEALFGANVAALTIYDMVKAIDKTMVIGGNRLLYKTGGKTGTSFYPPWESKPCILSINTSLSVGERKTAVHEATLRADFGLVDDAHGGAGHRQVSLLGIESIEKMRRQGVDVAPGDFAENITTVGMDLVSLPIGTRIQLGQAEVEVTQIGKVCHHRCAIYHQAGDCVMPREGIFAKVIQEGNIKTGDMIVRRD